MRPPRWQGRRPEGDEEEPTVGVLALSPQGYQVLGQYSEDEVVSSQVLAGLQFTAEEIFD